MWYWLNWFSQATTAANRNPPAPTRGHVWSSAFCFSRHSPPWALDGLGRVVRLRTVLGEGARHQHQHARHWRCIGGGPEALDFVAVPWSRCLPVQSLEARPDDQAMRFQTMSVRGQLKSKKSWRLLSRVEVLLRSWRCIGHFGICDGCCAPIL